MSAELVPAPMSRTPTGHWRCRFPPILNAHNSPHACLMFLSAELRLVRPLPCNPTPGLRRVVRKRMMDRWEFPSGRLTANHKINALRVRLFHQ